MKKSRLLTLVTVIAALLCSTVFASDGENVFAKSKKYENNFNDVAETSWYAGSVASVYELGLMEGVKADTFDTESEMSVAQAITIAARLHSIYGGTEIPEVEGGRWFQKYVDYAVGNSIMVDGQFDSYSRSVLSYEMVQLFAAALPEEFFPAINDISYIRDVPDMLNFYKDIRLFYNAGILNGNDEYGTFLPMSAVTRKRASAILARTALKENRLTFSLKEKSEEFTAKQALDIILGETVKGTLDDIVLVTADNYKVSAAEYRYYNFVCANDKSAVENEIKIAASLSKIIDEADISLSYDDLSELLISYYSSRVRNYGGLSYFDALESQNLTDEVYAKLSIMNELFYYAILSECDKISDDDVYNYALENDYICAKHILISKDTEDAYRIALETNLKLISGEDFDTLLAELGEDPGMESRKDGYFFNKGYMVEEFEKAAYALEEGELSEIVETTFGYHIIKRMPFDKDALVASPDFVTIKSNAGSSSCQTKLKELSNTQTLAYAENFEALSELLN